MWWTLWQLKRGNRDQRRRAAEVLGASGQVQAVKPLVGALDDNDAYVRQAALDRIGDV